MKNYTTFAETEALLRKAIGLPGSSIKAVEDAININPSIGERCFDKENNQIFLLFVDDEFG